MSAAAVPVRECPDVCRESLRDLMARRRLPFGETLRYAIQIATSLRDLHRHGLVFGALGSHAILVGPSGAVFETGGGLRHLGERRHDVKAFGALLEVMLQRTDGAEDLRREARALAIGCREAVPDMQKVAIALRLLGLRAPYRKPPANLAVFALFAGSR